ncbi:BRASSINOSTEROID INSENSITIVE 1-associated receptor kinase 1-like [Syzygium oleosum]|uniref:BRASSINOSTEROID INSENSITIVE 1-associated receptor kinase 1-like n=1 Tax=Syzygium oleosum TaxID=219896 RepID=UPI0024BB63F5|nr:BRASSINOSTEROID INSENSITIVE 1-associated receptor kinase 1-like [Syzygium oleosum]
MTFKFSTIDLTKDPPDFDPQSTPASRSSTICLPLNPAGCSFIKATTSCQVAAGASLRLANSASKFGCWRPSEPIQCPEEGRLKRFTVRELKGATNNFSETKKVGKGGFSCVYEGLLGDGSRVAIKRLTRHPALVLILRAEVKLGNMIWHRNLLPVHGFCLSSKHGEYTLVYTFMVNGSLDSLLLRGQSTEKPPLDWPTRKKIAIGAARGISHLHDLRIIHRDIKPANILLNEDFEAHIGDFGLALFMDEYKEKAVCEGEPNGEDAYFRSSTMGTIGYMDLASFTGTYSVKSDVYGFGMTLLELISGRRVWETTCLDGNELGLCAWAHALSENEQWERLVDTNMPSGYNESEVEKTVRLALLCTQLDPKKRPYMAEAVLFLEGIIGLEKRWEEYQLEDELPGLDNLSISSYSSSCPSKDESSGPR